MSFIQSPTMIAVQFAQNCAPTMSNKRKRSESTLSPSPASPQEFNKPSDTVPISTYPLCFNSSQSTFNEASHFHSRTRKRHRDNRPDEKTIHRTTYERLFSAARSPPPAPIAPTDQSSFINHLPNEPAQQRRSSSQSSLHNFWSLPSSAPSTTSDVASMKIVPKLTCNDCDSTFPASDVCADICMGGMDEDSPEMREYACKECLRTICDHCSVIETGVGRECLSCRTSMRKKWVGGIGWML